jgi:Mg/Co/Ni transporter MgtE
MLNAFEGAHVKITQSERETLAGPVAVGVVLGIFSAACTVGFASEYERISLPDWPIVLDAMLSFFAGVLFAVIPFGAMPVLVSRLNKKARQEGD